MTDLKVNETAMVEVLNNIYAPSLGTLTVQKMNDLSNLLTRVKWAHFKSLQIVEVVLTDLEDSYATIMEADEEEDDYNSTKAVKEGNYFSDLKMLTSLTLKGTRFNHSTLNSVLFLLPELFPRIKSFTTMEEEGVVLVSIKKLSKANFSDGTVVDLAFVKA